MNRIKEIATVFFKLGCVAFGGPAAHIAMMDKEIVEKRKWMDREHFLDLIGATNLIPGPNSTEMTMHCGHERGGIPGLFAAGISFIFPAVVITGIFAWLYTSYGELPEVTPFLAGIKPAVLAIIASAIFKLGKKAIKNYELLALGILVVTAGITGLNEIAALLLGGIAGTLYFTLKHMVKARKAMVVNPIGLVTLVSYGVKGLSTFKIFWSFLKVGAILYGSGYVLFAYLDAELVQNGWLSRPELLDAIAVGQFTPGPVLSTATFIGWQLGGLPGALAATAGIFLPSFLFVWFLNPLVPKMRQSRILGYFLDCVNVAAVGIMLAVLYKMGSDSITDWRTALVAILSTVAVFGWKKLSVIWVVTGGSLLGYLLYQF